MTIIQSIERLNNLAHILIVKSISHSLNNHFAHILLIKEEDKNMIGDIFANTLTDEYLKAQIDIYEPTVCCWCILRNKAPEFSILCRHILMTINEIELKDIPNRYLRKIPSAEQTKVDIIEDIKNNEKKDYTSIMAKISPLASLAHQNQEVSQLFDDSFEKAEIIKKQVNIGMPSAIARKGQFPKHLSKNVVFGGKPKTTKSYQCSNCHCFGHNAQTCPKKNK